MPRIDVQQTIQKSRTGSAMKFLGCFYTSKILPCRWSCIITTSTFCPHYTIHSVGHSSAISYQPSARMRSEGYCSCPVCMYVCVCPLIPAASHIGITKERYQRILRNTGIVLNFADFPKNASFKSYGVICLSRAAPAS